MIEYMQIKRRESKFSTLFRHYIRANPPKVTTHYELKQTTSNSLAFDNVESHQLDYCEAIESSAKGVLMRNQGGNGEPDYSFLHNDPVFIVIRYPKLFCAIPLYRFLVEKESRGRKSLTSERARELSTWSVDF